MTKTECEWCGHSDCGCQPGGDTWAPWRCDCPTHLETAEYAAWIAGKVQRDTQARETLERAVSEAQQALEAATVALAEFDREHEG